MRRAIRVLVFVDVGIFVLASALFLLQGGFGGGHGRWDRALGVLGLPWALIPWPHLVYTSDYLWLVLVPFAMNSVVVALCALGLAYGSRQVQRRQESRGV